MLRRFALPLLLLLGLHATAAASEAAGDDLLKRALAAEARLDSAAALELFLAAEARNPGEPFLLQKIARQYSDLIEDQADREERQRLARLALDYSERAVAARPDDPVNLLSVAISRGKLGLHSDVRTKVRFSRDVKDYALRALALDPDYAWAHHVLGRWHLEVAKLGMTARLVVTLFYGGLPPASYAEAITHLERAVQLEPTEAAHRIELGFAYAAVDRMEDARAAWQRGLDLPARAKHDAPAKERARAALARSG